MSRLSRETIVTEAIALADEQGLASVTVRALAERLGVHFTSLRHHVATKEELLDAMADALLGEAAARGGSGGDWQRRLRSLARGVRLVAEAHPGAIRVLTERAAAGPNALGVAEACLSALTDGGFSTRRAARAFAAFNSVIIGLTVERLGAPAPATDGDGDPEVDPARYPHVAAIAGIDIPMGRRWDDAVDAVLGGLAHMR